ncbi:MAG TPA: dihydrolipoamide acetyltransferase family protein [Methylomirabilota bacterium]|jgi:pyruvate dehydrogenase E2 component (dihydrolipoamide acetyltransferase)
MSVTKVVMPKLSEAMESGKIIKWLKQEGDRVSGGDILAEVETDKADVEMEAFGAGVLRKILVPAGGKAPVGALIAVIAEADEDIASVISAAPAPAAPAAAEPPAPTPAAMTSDRPGVPPQPRSEDFTTREESPAAPGAAGRSDAPDAPRTPVAPGPARAPAAAPGRATSAPAAATKAGASTGARAPSSGGAPVAPAATAPAAAADAPGRVKASPLAKKVAAQSGVDLRVVPGSGPGGRIVRRDVEAALTAPAATAAPATAAGPAMAGMAAPEAEYEDMALTPMRAAIAKRMPLAKAPVPHFYLTTEAAMDRAWALREELNELEGQPKISVTDMLVRACALTLLEHPGVNASFQGDSIRIHHRAHIGIAVALDDGLITPVLRDTHTKSLARIATEGRDLVERARARKLRANELSGATFSISNLGMFDVTEFSAIINPPEGAIIAVGSVRRVPVADGEGVALGRRMSMTLSCDHRVMDGAMGARFLQDLKRLLEEPLRLLL